MNLKNYLFKILNILDNKPIHLITLDHENLNWNLFPEHDFSDSEIKPPTHKVFYDLALQHELRSEVNYLVRAGMENNQLEFRMTEPFDPTKYE